jgi:putative effector of murein hydrolase LrgA (UPF0299 family)
MIAFMNRRIRDPKILRILNTTVEFVSEQSPMRGAHPVTHEKGMMLLLIPVGVGIVAPSQAWERRKST